MLPRDPQELFSLHETMRTLRPERKSRGRIIALWLLALGLAASISFALISGALPTEMRLASMRENMAAAAASVPSLMDGAISSLYRALCPYVIDCEVAQTAQVVAPPQERVRPLAQQPTPFATDKRKEATISTPSTSSPQTTVVKQYITQPIVERIIQSPPFASGLVLGASTDDTATKLADLQNQINALANLPRSVFVPSFSGPAQTTPVNTATFAQSQRIDNLSGTSLSNITVSGVSGLTDADIPDGLTASNYLPLSGGTLAGDLTLTGNFTVSGTQTLSGAITIPYLTATSTTQASGFQQFTATHGTTTSLFVNSLLSSPNATIGALTATSTLAVSGTLSLPEIPWGLLSTDTTGRVVATSSPTAEYFTATSSTPSLFNGGFLSLASSTIGNGTQAGGLTISGGATTTGNAYFAGNVGIGTVGPTSMLYVNSGTNGFGNNPTATIQGGGDSPTSVQLLLRNTREGAGAFGQDYENEVHLRLQAGTTNEHRAYINFANKGGVDQWLIGKNAANVWILYNSTDGHRLLMESTGGVAPNNTGNTYLSSSGSGSVQINNGNNDGDTLGTGGFEVFGGGTYPRTSLFKVSALTDTDAVLRATNNGSGYAPASLLLIATNAGTRGQGLYQYNTVSDTFWFIGVPYNVAGAKWMVSYEFNGTWDPAVAQTDRALFVIQNNGNVGIGTTSPPYKLTVDNAASAGVVAGFENSEGECTINPTSSSVNCSSDASLKKNIVPIGGEEALDGVRGLDPVFFNWNAEDASSSEHSGFIAQSVQGIFPDLVSAGSNGKLLLNYAGFTTYIVKAVQHLAAKVSDLAATVAAFADHFTTKELTFTRATGDEIDVNTVKSKTLCLGSTCVTESELQALLRQTGQSPAAALADPAPQSPPTTGDQPADATATESAPPVTEPTTTANDLPPLAPEQEPEPEAGAPTALDTADLTEPTPATQ